jgi:hypothetical protein
VCGSFIEVNDIVKIKILFSVEINAMALPVCDCKVSIARQQVPAFTRREMSSLPGYNPEILLGNMSQTWNNITPGYNSRLYAQVIHTGYTSRLYAQGDFENLLTYTIVGWPWKKQHSLSE